jgi:hypothetical protein
MRRPSEIYWNGIHRFDLINTNGLGMQSFFARHKNSMLESLLMMPEGDDATGDDIDAEFDNFFKIRFNYTRDWNNRLSLELTLDESEILRDKMLSQVKDSALSILLQNNLLYDEFKLFSTFREFALQAIKLNIPEELKQLLIMAHDFSELMIGAHITYNCMLQNAKFSSSHFEADWTEWSKAIETTMIDFKGFNPDNLFDLALTAKKHTRQFIFDWWLFVNSDKKDLGLRNQLIENQEFNNKRGKARLRLKKHDDIMEGKWIGLRYLDYRYQNAKTILSDITNTL